MAPAAGLEPATGWLTATYSTDWAMPERPWEINIARFHQKIKRLLKKIPKKESLDDRCAFWKSKRARRKSGESVSYDIRSRCILADTGRMCVSYDIRSRCILADTGRMCVSYDIRSGCILADTRRRCVSYDTGVSEQEAVCWNGVEIKLPYGMSFFCMSP